MQEQRNSSELGMAEHIALLCETHGVELIHYTGCGRAYPRDRKIKIKPVKSPWTYFIALHELGHVIGPGRSGRRLEKETAAWLWALDTAICRPTPSVRRKIAESLRSYLEAGRRSYGLRQNIAEPPPHSNFWKLANVDDLEPVKPLPGSTVEDRQRLTLDDGFGHWLAGLLDGEGSFTLQKNTSTVGTVLIRPRMKLTLRDDDRSIIEEIYARTGIGILHVVKTAGNPQYGWTVSSVPDVVELVALLKRYPLRAKKAADFEVWARAVAERTSENRLEVMLALKAELEAGRRYRPMG